MPKPERGYVIIRLDDLAALLATRPGQRLPAPVAAELPQPPADAWRGLAGAVAMLTARLGHHDVDLGQLADEADTSAVITALVAMAAAGLRGCLDDGAAMSLLQDLGEVAAFRGRGPGGESL